MGEHGPSLRRDESSDDTESARCCSNRRGATSSYSVISATRGVIGSPLRIELAGPSSSFATCQNSLQSAHRKKSRFGEDRIPSSGTTSPLAQPGHCVRADINQLLHFRATHIVYFGSFEPKQ